MERSSTRIGRTYLVAKRKAFRAQLKPPPDVTIENNADAENANGRPVPKRLL